MNFAKHSNTSELQTALERQDLSCMYPAHHELESVVIVIIITGCTCLCEHSVYGNAAAAHVSVFLLQV